MTAGRPPGRGFSLGKMRAREKADSTQEARRTGCRSIYGPGGQIAWGKSRPHDASPTWKREVLVAMNDAFCEAMRKAISAGLEHAPIGIVTAPCTRCPTFVQRGVRWEEQTGLAA
jgi:hypothetical protein